MEYDPPLARGTLLRRYKRFLADILTDDGEQLTVHCPNTGAMSGCADPGSVVWYSRSDRATRKYPHTMELVGTRCGAIVGINSSRANALVGEAVRIGRITQLPGEVIGREVQIPGERGRFDLVVRGLDGAITLVEVKSVTLAADRLAAFPDTRSERATRHVRALERLCLSGQRTALIFCVQRNDVDCVTTADEIDPVYGAALRAAHASGVVVAAYRASMSATRIELVDAIPVMLR